MRPASIQYIAGLPLNKKAAAMIANAQTSDQTIADVPSFLELAIMVRIVAWLVMPSRGDLPLTGRRPISDRIRTLNMRDFLPQTKRHHKAARITDPSTR